jgi:hypothetical protein
MMIAGVATVLARAPIAAFVDCTYRKRGLIVVAYATVAIGALAMSRFPTFAPVAIAQAGTASTALAAGVAGTAGYSIAFLFLAAVALTAFMLFWIAVPETGSGFDKPKNQRMFPLILTGSSAPAE